MATNRLTSYQSAIEAWTEKHLHPYLDAVRGASWIPPRAKEINDAVWKTVVLRPLEITILDSPLLQRLRWIKQLGVAHWTYPSADHSRFEHSIGAVHTVSLLIRAMRGPNGAGEGHSNALSEDWVNLLRLAALCHDMGHGFMSHVSENALRRNAHVEQLRQDFREERASEDITLADERSSLSEMAAYYMLGAPAFRELIDVAQARIHAKLPDNPCEKIQRALVGQRMTPDLPLLQELISGPFDADKLDYMTRDSHAAGIPSVTDVPRLIQKVRLVEVAWDYLPPGVDKVAKPRAKAYHLGAIALSGAQTLDELLVGRTLLFDKVYRHQKVRAAEAMIATLVRCLSRVPGVDAGMLPLQLLDHEVIFLEADSLAKALGVDPDQVPEDLAALAADIGGQLRVRKLVHRAYAFAITLPRDPLRHDMEQRDGLGDMKEDSEDSEGAEVLHKSIVAEVQKMLELVPHTDWPTPTVDRIASAVCLDPPTPESPTSVTDRALLQVEEGQVTSFRTDYPSSNRWSEAYLGARDIGFVYAPRDLAPYAYLASECVARRDYGVRTPQSARVYAKVDVELVEKLRAKLAESGFYKGYPPDLHPIPSAVDTVETHRVIRGAVDRLSTFHGLGSIAADNPSTVRVDAERIRTWLCQFTTNEQVAAALRLVENIKVVGRDELHSAVAKFMQAHPEFEGAAVCPFGSPKDSSGVVTYFASDLAVRHGWEALTLREALESDRSILFIDDFISSGRQAHTILMQWFGKEDDDCLKERHVTALPQYHRDALIGRTVGFVFSAGERDGQARLAETAKRLGLTAHVTVGIKGEQLPRAFASIDEATTLSIPLRDIGESLLRTTKPEKEVDDPHWYSGRALGYGNRGYLVTFPYNVPTQTLTLLWSRGDVADWPWLPLIPRREKN